MTNNELRIMHVIRAKPPGELGGADMHVLDLATAQLGDGHRVRVICLGPAQIATSLRVRGIPSVEVHSLSMFAWVKALRSLLRAEPPDVLHSHGYRADLVSTLVSALKRRPRWIVATTVHGFIRVTPGLRLLTWANEWVLRRADLVIAVSAAESKRLGKIMGRPIAFIPNGVSSAQLLTRVQAAARLGTEPSRRVVAFIGRLSPEKRPDLFIDMAVVVAREYPAVEFAVIGTGALRRQLEARAATGPASRLRFTGLVTEVSSLMTAIDVFICPSDSEGTPRVVIEAMMAGVPVVATRVGGIADLIVDGKTGFLVEPGSAAALAASTIAVLTDTVSAAAIAERARNQAIDCLSAARMWKQVELAYRFYLAARPQPQQGDDRGTTARG